MDKNKKCLAITQLRFSKSARKLLSLLIATVMILTSIDFSGLGVIEAQAEETMIKNLPVTLYDYGKQGHNWNSTSIEILNLDMAFDKDVYFNGIGLAGLNKGDNNTAAYWGIVNDKLQDPSKLLKLKGRDLFGSKTKHKDTTYKKIFNDVSFPFNYTPETNRYYYNSQKQGVSFDQSNNKISLIRKINGFWPFGQNQYFFGMNLDVNFMMPREGKLSNGDNMAFKFSGDDDLWIYIDNILALDLGGVHGANEGVIDFANKIVVYKKDPLNQSAHGNWKNVINNYENKYSNYAYAVSFSDIGLEINDYTAHNMKLFYLERGAGQSNCMMDFNLITFTGNPNVSKVIGNVNPALEHLADKDTFNFQISTGKSEESNTLGREEYDSTNISTGSFTHEDTDNKGQWNMGATHMASFGVKTDNSTYVKMAETGIANNISQFQYESTKVEVFDMTDNNTKLGENASSGGNIGVTTQKGYQLKPEHRLLYQFTNNVKSQNLSITKQLEENITDSTTDFAFKLYLQQPKGGELIPYTGKVTLDNGSVASADGGVFSLKAGQTGVIEKLPVGYRYQIKEILPAGSSYKLAGITGVPQDNIKSNQVSGTIGNDNINITFTNTISDKALTIKKVNDIDKPVSGAQFQVEDTVTNRELALTISKNGSEFKTETVLKYNTIYKITETKTPTDNFAGLKDPIYVKLNTDGTGLDLVDAAGNSTANPLISVDGYVITVKNQELAEVAGKKTWSHTEDIKPASIRVYLVKNGVRTDTFIDVVPDSNGTWAYSFGKLPKYENNKEITYTVTDEQPGYTPTSNGFNLVNKSIEQEFTIKKLGISVDNQENQLNRIPFTVTEVTQQNGTIVDGASEDYNSIGRFGIIDEKINIVYGKVYKITEEKIPIGYTGIDPFYVRLNPEWPDSLQLVTFSEEEKNWIPAVSFPGVSIDSSNSLQLLVKNYAKVEMSGTKTWVGDTNATRPDSAKWASDNLVLMADGEPVEGAKAVLKTPVTGDTWYFSFKGLPRFNNSGKLIEYSIREIVPDGYSAEITIDKNGTHITNKYETASLSLSGKKVLNGRTLAEEEFSFVLSEVNSDWNVESGNTIDRVLNSKDGSFKFSGIEYDYKDVGTHYYTIHEENTSLPGISYDEAIRKIRVKVTQDEKTNKISYTVEISSGASQEEWAQYTDTSVIFTNTYTPPVSGEIKLPIKKMYSGPAEDTTFTFDLKETDENYNPLASNVGTHITITKKGQGETSFALDNLSVGTHYYMISERPDPTAAQHGWKLSDDSYYVKVVVEDLFNGEARADAKIYNSKELTEEAPAVFTNVYTPPADGSAVIIGSKNYTGNQPSDYKFQFELTETDSAYKEKLDGDATTQSVSRLGVGKFSFTLDNLAVGTHYFTMKELSDATAQSYGWKQDTTVHQIKVEVTDNHNGTTSTNIIIDGSANKKEAVFSNEYSAPASGPIAIKGSKKYAGDESRDITSTFYLDEADNNYTVKTGDNAHHLETSKTGTGDFEFSLEDLKVGTHYYVMSEAPGGLYGWEYSKEKYYVQVTVEDTHTGKADSTVLVQRYNKDQELVAVEGNKGSFTNNYEAPANGEAEIIGSKAYEGDTTADKTFTIQLDKADDSYEVLDGARGEHQTVTVTGQENFKFDLKNLAVGTHHYVMSELKEDIPGWKYSDQVYYIDVVIRDLYDGTTEPEVTVYKKDGSGNLQTVAENRGTFVNTYTAPANGKASITGSKTYSGSPTENKTFQFKLEKANEAYETLAGAASLFQTADKEGDFTFDLENLSVGTHYYVMTEERGNLPGWEYSNETYYVEVVITDIYNGNTSSSVTVKKMDSNNILVPSEDNKGTFTNTYTAPSNGSAVITGNKKYTGSSTEDKTFTFNLEKADENYQVIVGDGRQKETQTVTGQESFSFTLKHLPVGTHHYVMTEEQGDLAGWTYSDQTYYVDVIIGDSYDGKTTSNVIVKKLNENNVLEEVKTEAVVFLNTYEAPANGEAVVTGNKVYAGSYSEDKTFTLNLDKSDENYHVITGEGGQHLKESRTGAGDINFNLNHLPVGTHHYVMTEEQGNLAGWTYSDQTYYVDVVIEDMYNGSTKPTVTVYEMTTDGSLTKVEEGKGEFVNTYTAPANGTAVVTGSKEYAGSDTVDRTFTFNLDETDENYEIVTEEGSQHLTQTKDKEGDFTFTLDNLSVGTHHFVMTEEHGDLAGWEYSSQTYYVDVTVTDKYNGTTDTDIIVKEKNSEGILNETENNKGIFTNTYTAPSDGNVTVTGKKAYAGSSTIDREFIFYLDKADSNYDILTGDDADRLTAKATGQTTFDFNLDNLPVGTHYYVMSESKGSIPGWTYSQQKYAVEVKVEDNYDGKTETKATVYQLDEDSKTVEADGNIGLFTNTYNEPANGSTDISGYKYYSGDTSQNYSFTFQLQKTEADGTPIAAIAPLTVSHTGTGNFSFHLTDLTVGTHYYEMNEVADPEAVKLGWTQDMTAHKVKVVVTDKYDGTLDIKSYIDGKPTEAVATDASFTNIYTAPSNGKANLTGQKRYSGDASEDTVFSFSLVQTDENGQSLGNGIKRTAEIAGEGTFSFAFDTLKVGTYYFDLYENTNQEAINKGWTLSDAVYKFKVVVTDNYNATTSTEVFLSNDGSFEAASENSAVFTNVYDAPENGEAVVTGHKSYEGAPKADREFTFTLTEADETFAEIAGAQPMTTSITGEGDFKFELSGLSVGTHRYILKEEADEEAAGKGWALSTVEYPVRIVVEDNFNGTTTAKVYVGASQTEAVPEDMTFTNSYSVDKAEIELNGVKILDSDATQLIADEFEFQLKQDGKIIKTARNDESGYFSFGTFTFNEEGTYEYTVVENKNYILGDDDEGFTFDNNEYHVIVEVTDNSEGQLVADVKVDGEDFVENSTISFENSFSTPLNDLIVKKQVIDHTDEEFVFEIKVNGELFDGQYTLNNDSDLLDISDGVFTLHGGDTATIKNIKRGAEYEIREADSKGYAVLVNGRASDTFTDIMTSPRKTAKPVVEFTNLPKDQLALAKTRIGGEDKDTFTFKVRYSRANASDATPGDSDVATSSNSSDRSTNSTARGSRKNYKTLLDDIFDNDGGLTAFKGNYTLYAKDESGDLESKGTRTATNGEIKLHGGELALITGFVVDTYYEVEEVLPEESDYRLAESSATNPFTGNIATGSNAEFRSEDFVNLADFVNVFKYSEIRTRYHLRSFNANGEVKDTLEGSRPNSGYDKFETDGDLSKVESEYLSDTYRVNGKDYNYDLVEVTVYRTPNNNGQGIETIYSDTAATVENALSDFNIHELDRDAVYRISIDFIRVKGSAILHKTGLNGAPLSGAKFQLYNENDSAVGEVKTTKEDGTIKVENLLPGSYYFIETEAPAGYTVDKTLQEFELVNENNYMDVVEISMENKVAENGMATLKKVDADGNGLEGVEFALYKADSELVKDSLVTDSNGEISVSDLAMGDYYFQETNTLVGYMKDTTPVMFRITFDDLSHNRVVSAGSFTNYYEEDGKIVLTKTDRNGNPLAGAVFDLYKVGDTDPVRKGLVTSSTVESYGTITVTDLEIGSYYFVETKAPDGYITPAGEAARSNTVEINFADHIRDNQEAVVTVINDPITGSVTLHKTNADGTLELRGAEFSLYMADGTRVAAGLVTNGDGIITYSNLPIGNYYFQETKAPEGYKLPTGTDAVTNFVVEADNMTELTVTNTKISSGGNNNGGGSNGGGSNGSGTNGPGGTPITDNPVPLANLPASGNGSDGTFVIDDGLVPLAALPKTGDSPFRGLIALFTGLMLGLAALFGKKKKEDEQ